ncbi:SHIRT domain-containing protein [Faecalicatena acetigenes]|uniref:SHIRT domain-containing protein n=1 Tax=Faecalicatena acetigenes TaxID=2981790 RepID=A0ABT2TA75_9FIRM|nr:SHIRT domain-containing protein [Faecalicatena acetigenes]MCU6747188.1 SHIRT domain-containing protein [Faecalicatena acetigenes]SCH70395.1 Uncharacterised protein [uncultured Clostridium sp.]
MKRRIFVVCVFVMLLLGVYAVPASADEAIYEASDFVEFKAAVEEINAKTADETYTISLTGDIDFGSAGYNCAFFKNTVILGNGHTINIGSEISNGELRIRNGAVLSLGKNNGSNNENQLKVTVNAPKRSSALLHIGAWEETGILNIYDGVELTGCTTNGSSLGSAVNISNGEFNMYGGDIHGNTNEAVAAMGGAVAGDGRYGKVVFNMYGGSIRDNKTLTNAFGYGGGVFLANAAFNMEGGSIRENIVGKTTDNAQGYGGGVMLYAGEAVLRGGEISNNTSSNFGGGIFTHNGADIVIKTGFSITENSASQGGGLCNNGNSATVEEGAIVANNTAAVKGDDIAHYGNSLTIAPAQSMNMLLSTDHSNHLITGWYLDDPRWQADSAQEIDVTVSLGKVTTFLKAAYGSKYVVTYRFVNDSEGEGLPAEIVALLPADTQEHHVGDTVIPIQPTQLKVAVAGGVWEFKGYDADHKIVEDIITEFVGTWAFKPNKGSLNGTPGTKPKSAAARVEGKEEQLRESGAQNINIPKTGDTTNIKLYSFLFAAPIMILLALFYYRK